MTFARPPECALLTVLDAMGGKWPVMVMATLWEGPHRFNALRRQVGASQKMLAQTLRQLERDGLVSRTVTPTVPITVEYAMTPLGETLARTIDSLRRWSDKNIGQVLAARQAWQAANPDAAG
jgi:DNA-binding HxlR family transcriptional regulator